MDIYFTRKKRPLAILILLIFILSLAACGPNVEEQSTNHPQPQGRFECTQYEKAEKGLQPIDEEDIYEYLTFNSDGSGLWESALDSEFTWKGKGEKITIIEPVGDTENTFYGLWDGEKFVLDVLGYERVFEKEKPAPLHPEASSDMSWGIKPAGSIQIPSQWYGVAIFKNCVGFDFEKIKQDVWGFMEEEPGGKASFKLYLDPEAKGHPILSMYINKEERAWLTPAIGENDAWLIVDPDSGHQQDLDEDDYWTILAPYNQGAIDILHDYHDAENSQYGNGRLFIRELGTAWNEKIDPLPPGYDEYKKKFFAQ